ncbi:MAG TPA: hypothetical protein VMT86_07140 [Bryobacteraceae bacterium]|nr:hypothetical protein [Bryobacteraceae bacterium]
MRILAFSLMALAAAALPGQTVAVPGAQPPVTGPVYWSTTAPDCSSLAGESAVAITGASGTVGYSCYVSGTFVWLAAGGGWSTAIRVAAPASGAVGVDYSFYDGSGNSLQLDSTANGAAAVSGDDVNFALAANQPAEIGLLGATSGAPKYASVTTGSVYAVFYCPDAATCANVLPQLLYSALPATPWSLSVPIAWDTALSTDYSAVGVDDGGAQRVSLVIYNEDIAATSYRIEVFDSTGALAASGTTPSIPPLQSLAGGAYGEGGTYAAMLSGVVTGTLPSGAFKILVDGGSIYSAVEVLQFNGASATALQVGYDSQPDLTSSAAVQRSNLRRSRVALRPKTVFRPLK